jgi:3-deoxy-D-manno-octulosonic-acid transferase
VSRFIGGAALALYAGCGRLLEPFAGGFLSRRERRGKEDPSRRGERLGRASRPRPAGRLIWVHAASVGETVAALPLIGPLAERGPAILLTTGTVTAAQVAAVRLPVGAIHQFVPLDTPAAVRRFLDHWRPDLALFVESELWPTTLQALHRRRLPLVVVNAKMSDRSFRAWHRALPIARRLMTRIDLCLVQSLADAERLRTLGAARVAVCGNLKFDVPPPPAKAEIVEALRQQIRGRPVLLAASTHPGEETAVVAAHREVARGGAKPLTILAPRHPERGEALATEIAASGLTVARRSKGEAAGDDTDICLADTIGEMGLWYRLADIAFLGGSLTASGGHNPIEPAMLGVPVLSGEHVWNFRDLYGALAEAKAVVMVRDSAELAAAARRLIENPDERDRLAREARACVERFTGALDRTLQALEPYLASSTGPDHAV